ncbi:MAG: class II aldolase/adducin family protein [Bacillota bacterium]
MQFELLHPADQLVMIMKRIYGYGMTTTSGGNLSIREENGDIWITPAGIDKGSLTRNDIVCVKADGKKEGIHQPSSEFPFHKEIYNRRPDIGAIIHAHPSALVSFSIVRQVPNTKLIPNAHLISAPVSMAEYKLPGSEELGDVIADEFEKGINTVMLENHGVVLGARNLFDAFMSFETLDFCARLEINAKQLGQPVSLSESDIIEYQNKQKKQIAMEEFTPEYHDSKEREARREICDLIHRAYQQRLFTSTQGTFSQRLGKDSFLITPYGKDRKYIDISDLVKIKNAKKEAGKTPSRSTMLHKYIYEENPEINSIIIAHPPNIMTFAVTHEKINTKIIPESYIMLQNIPEAEFGSTFFQPQKFARRFSPETSIIMIKNDSVIFTGDNMINTFDKLEVAEFSAKSIISANQIGEIVNINQEQIDSLEKAFDMYSS